MTGIEPNAEPPQPDPEWPPPAPLEPPPPRERRQLWRPLGALLFFAAALMTLFGSFLTLFTSDVQAPNNDHFVLAVSGWGLRATINGAPDAASSEGIFATNGPPLIFAACVLLVAALLALLAAAAPASVPVGRISALTAVAGTAFLAGTTWTIGMQELSWLGFFGPNGAFSLGPRYDVSATINVGFWLLITATAAAIAGGVFAFLPLRRRVRPRGEPDTPPLGIPGLPGLAVVHRLPDEPPDEPPGERG